ncbi:MAG: PAS domain S-box protein [Chloroflexales bacterium]|nr:PAS domain S-box protein [Chloroflexales bacterium]
MFKQIWQRDRCYAEQAWLEQVFNWLILMCLGIAALLAGMFAMDSEGSLGLKTALLIFFIAILIWAKIQVRQGQSYRSALVVSITLLIISVVEVIISPSALIHALLLPVLATIIVFPILQPHSLRRFLVAAWLVGIALALIHKAIATSTPTDAVTENFVLLSELITISIVMALLDQYHRQWSFQLDSERQRTDDARYERDKRYKIVSEMTSDYIYTLRIEPDGQIISEWVTEAFSRIMEGYTVEEFAARGGFQSVLHPDDKPINEQRVQTVLSGQEDVSELRIITKKGNVRWLRAYTKPEWDAAQGRVVRVFGAMQDITIRKLDEAELKASENRYRQLFELSPDAVIAHCEDRIVFINAAGVKLLGAAQPEQLIGRAVFDFVHTDYHDLARGRIKRIVEEGITTPSTEMQIRRLDETSVVIETTASAFIYNGKPAVQAAVRDISARKQAEAEQQAIKQKLQAAQKLESLGVLAGGIAHDFNNLLMGIMGNASLAMMDLSKNSSAYESIEQIELATRRAADLTQQMLAYAGRGRLEMRLIDFNDFIQEKRRLLQAAIKKNISFMHQFTPNLPLVLADPVQMCQVVMNLIVNAAEAIGDNQGTITIESGILQVDQGYIANTLLGAELKAGKYVFLTVTDTGCGMDETTQARMFDPFFTTKFAGRGLGLAAVLGIMRSHQGAIKIQSNPGQGTRFTILLPAARSAEFEPLHADAPVQPNRTPKAQYFVLQGTVLVVDDEESVRKAAKRMLERLGVRVLLAADGPTGIELFMTYAADIDCILLDMTMPHLDGKQVFAQICEIDPRVPVVLMSGYAEQETLSLFGELGPVGFLKKPFTTSDVFQKIAPLLPSPWQTDPARLQ